MTSLTRARTDHIRSRSIQENDFQRNRIVRQTKLSNDVRLPGDPVKNEGIWGSGRCRWRGGGDVLFSSLSKTEISTLKKNSARCRLLGSFPLNGVQL